MKFRHTGSRSGKKVELQMTPMIDIVFLLLVFFILTFRIVAIEGDFNIQTSAAEPDPDIPPEVLTSPLKLILRADDDGHLASIHLNERPFDSMRDLGDFMISIYAADSVTSNLRETVEVEIDCDPHLHYRHAMEAITRVHGFIDGNGKRVPLIEKIKFSRARRT